MIIQSCFNCRFHQIKDEEKEGVSYCQKENCWSEFSKCIMKKALNRFLEQESSVLSAPEIQVHL
jgi:hypothetical protein